MKENKKNLPINIMLIIQIEIEHMEGGGSFKILITRIRDNKRKK